MEHCTGEHTRAWAYLRSVSRCIWHLCPSLEVTSRCRTPLGWRVLRQWVSGSRGLPLFEGPMVNLTWPMLKTGSMALQHTAS